jgi:hypothetical protein
MSVSFYNANGTMIGADLHEYLSIVLPDPAPVPIPALHFVFASFDGRCEDEKTRPKNVTSDGQPMIQKEFKRISVGPHLPLTPAPPHPSEYVAWTMIILLSGSTAMLAVATVTGGGQPLACCLYNCLGANLNCGDPFDLPLDVVINENSVLTQPTLGDFVEAIISSIISGVISVAVGKGSEGVGKGMKKYVKKKIRDEITIPIRKLAEEIVKNYLGDIAKDIKDSVTGHSKAKAVLSSLGVTHV